MMWDFRMVVACLVESFFFFFLTIKSYETMSQQGEENNKTRVAISLCLM